VYASRHILRSIGLSRLVGFGTVPDWFRMRMPSEAEFEQAMKKAGDEDLRQWQRILDDVFEHHAGQPDDVVLKALMRKRWPANNRPSGDDMRKFASAIGAGSEVHVGRLGA
jgi:hypothetical protein